jgi:hypothetical protein
MIEIYGASDDLIEVEGCEGADEFYVDAAGRWQADLIAPGGEAMRVRAEWDPPGACGWVISLGYASHGVPFPDWGNGTGPGPGEYSVLVRVDAPEGTRLANVKPEPS